MASTPTTKPLLDTLHGKAQMPPPFWFMRQAGRYLPEYRELRAKADGFLAFCYDPKLACEATLQPIRRFAPDGAILFSDILVVPDALGIGVDFVEGTGPVLDAVTEGSAIPDFDSHAFHAHLRPVYDTLGQLADKLPAEVTLLGFAGAPWTLASYIVEGGPSRDFAAVKGWAYDDPDGFGALIDRLTEAVGEILVHQIAAGAQVVQLFDSWAGVLSAEQFSRWCVTPLQKIVATIREASPETPIIAFPRGVGPLYAHLVIETGVDGISLDAGLPLHWAKEVLQKSVVLQGNLDPRFVVVGGDAMEHAARHILEVLGGRPFVFNLGHGLVPETPPENVEHLARIIRDWVGSGRAPLADPMRLD